MMAWMYNDPERHDDVASFNNSDAEMYVITFLCTIIVLAFSFIIHTWIQRDVFTILFMNLSVYLRTILDNMYREEMPASARFQPRGIGFGWPYGTGFILLPGHGSGYVDDRPFGFQHDFGTLYHPFGGMLFDEEVDDNFMPDVTARRRRRPLPFGVQILSIIRIREVSTRGEVNENIMLIVDFVVFDLDGE